MSRLQKLKEEKAGYLARVEAIAKIATDDKRDQTPEEIAEVTALLDKAEAVAPKIAHEERVEKAMAELAVKSAPPAPGAPAVHTKARKAPKGWDSYEEAHIAGAWLSASVLNSNAGRAECKALGLNVQGAMSEGSNVDGGYLVPVELSRQIIRQVEEYGVFSQFARKVNMASDRFQFVARTSGVTSYFVGETPSSLTESSPQVNLRELSAKRLAVLTKFSRDVAEDAFADIAMWAAQEAALAISTKQDACGFIGDGTSTYGGMIGIKDALAAGSEYEALAGNTAFSTLDLADFESMVAKLPNFAGLSPRWYISRQGYYASMSRLQMAAGGNTIQDFGSGPVLQFLGFPVTLTQSMNVTTTAQTSTKGLVYFGDLSMAATIGTRRGITLQVLREKYAIENQIGLLWDTRFDISVHEVGDASNPGPLVGLKTPGA
jgi:HK97 family phage major capsid protein